MLLKRGLGPGHPGSWQKSSQLGPLSPLLRQLTSQGLGATSTKLSGWATAQGQVKPGRPWKLLSRP